MRKKLVVNSDGLFYALRFHATFLINFRLSSDVFNETDKTIYPVGYWPSNVRATGRDRWNVTAFDGYVPSSRSEQPFARSIYSFASGPGGARLFLAFRRASVLPRRDRSVRETYAHVLHDHVWRQELLQGDGPVTWYPVERIAHTPSVRITGIADTTVAGRVVARLSVFLRVLHLSESIKHDPERYPNNETIYNGG